MAKTIQSAALAVALAATATLATAQEVTLRVHHFMAETSGLHAELLVPFKESIEEASDGRIEIELFASMALGGGPADLYDQAADGAVDIILTLPGYTAGRFSRTEVFELPFLMDDTVAGSKAFYDLVETELQNEEYDETHILSAWVHSRGHLHAKEPIRTLEDLQGKEMRGPTRMVTNLLAELGAVPVGMPLPAIPENLSKGVISGAALPWEITPSIRLNELVTHHTTIETGPALYTATFILAMNLDAYEDMPDDLRAILDAETGKPMAEMAGNIMRNRDQVGRDAAAGNNIFELGEAEVARWVEAAQPVYAQWVEDAANDGFDGQAAIDQARALIEANN